MYIDNSDVKHVDCEKHRFRVYPLVVLVTNQLHVLDSFHTLYQLFQAGFSALHLAAQNGHNESSRVLLYAGCNTDHKNNVSMVNFAAIALQFTNLNQSLLLVKI